MTKLSREEQARLEIGQTTISQRLVIGLFTFFIVLIFAVPLIQQGLDLYQFHLGSRTSAVPQCYDIFSSAAHAIKSASANSRTPYQRVMQANTALMHDMNQYETTLEERNWFSSFILPISQWTMTRYGGVGNEKAYCGFRQWLFYRLDIDYLTNPGFLDPAVIEKRRLATKAWEEAPQPNPIPAILQFKQQLAARGIELLLVPLPPKASIAADHFCSYYFGEKTTLQNQSYADFLRQLNANNIAFFDPSETLQNLKSDTHTPVYLTTDTHWTPAGVDATARALAAYIHNTFSTNIYHARPTLKQITHQETIKGIGDIITMLKIPSWQHYYQPQPVNIEGVFDAQGKPWQEDPEAAILFLGDSFSNIYSLPEMGWGSNAGLVERLSYYLGQPLDRIIRNDHASYVTRQELSHELAKGNDRLKGKKLVVWEFAMRELASGNWKLLPMDLRTAPVSAEQRFFLPPANMSCPIQAIVKAVTTVPKPGSVPYKDHIMTVQLTEIRPIGTNAVTTGQGQEALVYLMSMKNNKWTPAAMLRVGQKVELIVRRWNDVSAQYETINRSEIDDEALLLEEPLWGEFKNAKIN